MRIPTLACLLMTFLFPVVAGCVTSKYVSVGDETYLQRPEDHPIDVYLDADAPVYIHQSIADAKADDEIPAGAEFIGRIDTTGMYTNWSNMVKDAKEKARILGGDAIVIGGGGLWARTDAYGNYYENKKLSIRVLRYGEYTTQQSLLLRDLGAAIHAMEAPAGPCVMCSVASDSKQDRRTLTLDGQLIEFCSKACAGKFYENPNWREFRLK